MAKAVWEAKFKSMFKEIIRDLMGESALIILEHQLSKQLAEPKPFESLLTDPGKFYNALASIIGPNAAHALLKLLFKRIAEKHKLTCFRADEFIAAMIAGEESAKEQISKLFQKVCEDGDD